LLYYCINTIWITLNEAFQRKLELFQKEIENVFSKCRVLSKKKLGKDKLFLGNLNFPRK